MKKVLVLLMLLVLVAGLVMLAGCGDDKKTVETPFGDVTVDEGEVDFEGEDVDIDYDEDEGKVTYETDEGEASYEYSEEAPSEDELGAPIYPDSEFVPGSGVVARSSNAGEEVSVAGAEFTTEDDFEDVVDFYSDAMGDPMVMDETADEATWMMTLSDESIVTVTVKDEGGEVKISIGRLGSGE